MVNGRQEQIISFAPFELDPAQRRLMSEGKKVQLNAKAFDLLVYLAENAGRIVTKEEIMDAVWENQFVEESNLKVQMSALRKVLGERQGDHRFLVTIPGKGYKFIADIQTCDREIFSENLRLSRLVTGEDEEEEIGMERKGEKTSKSSTVSISQKMAVAGLAVLLVLAFGAYQLFRTKESSIPFEKIKFTRLTNSGKVGRAAISPDGKYIAYVLNESEGNSIWVQQVGIGSNVLVVPPTKGQIWEMKFFPDGSRIYYTIFESDKSDLEHFRVPALGGVSEKIPNVIASFIAFSPDGKRVAYAQSDSAAGKNYLVIADADGTNQQRIAEKDQPNTFETNASVVAWSPDGETIACLVNHFEADASYSSIVGINIKDGTEKLLSEQRWLNVFSLLWIENGSGLLVSASDTISGNNQIRFLSYPNGEVRPITNDLSQYGSLSATADGKSFIAIQTNKTSTILVSQPEPDEFKEIVSETGELHPFVWTPEGKIIFRSSKDGISNLWTMDTEGNNRKQLTVNAQVDSRGLCISPDGKYLVFASWRLGKSNLWRVDAGGGNLTQLTNGEIDTRPQCSPDGRSIIYQRGLHTKPVLWKVKLDGGEPVQLTDFYAKWNSISSDGLRVSFLQMVDRKWRIGIISSAGGEILQQLDTPASLSENEIRWSSDDRSLLFIGSDGGVFNIWNLPLDGTETKPVTNFKSHYLEDFGWSPDGSKLAVAKSLTVSDAVFVERIE